jgi:hypothetical protein
VGAGSPGSADRPIGESVASFDSIPGSLIDALPSLFAELASIEEGGVRGADRASLCAASRCGTRETSNALVVLSIALVVAGTVATIVVHRKGTGAHPGRTDPDGSGD